MGPRQTRDAVFLIQIPDSWIQGLMCSRIKARRRFRHRLSIDEVTSDNRLQAFVRRAASARRAGAGIKVLLENGKCISYGARCLNEGRRLLRSVCTPRHAHMLRARPPFVCASMLRWQPRAFLLLSSRARRPSPDQASGIRIGGLADHRRSARARERNGCVMSSPSLAILRKAVLRTSLLAGTCWHRIVSIVITAQII